MAAALPILASAELDEFRRRPLENRRYGTSCSSIDESLRGGFESGRISCISGDRGTGKTAIAIHLVVSYLLSTEGSEVGILDTTGTFDVLRLHSIISSRLKSSAETANANGRAEFLMTRIKIMRVFDFIGIVESVTEISAALEKQMVTPPPSGIPVSAPRALEIPDSEDEDSDTDNTAFHEPERSEPAKMGMLIIDNITSAMNPLLRSSHIQAHSLLVTFLRSLRNLTRDHNLAAVILNSVITARSNSSINLNDVPVLTSTPWHDQSSGAKGPMAWDFPSIFMDNTFRPALGKTFTYFLDFHVLLSMLPKTRRDAELMYSSQASFNRRDRILKPKLVNLIEVLLDRSDSRAGRWAAFAIEGGMQLSTKI